jgi:hypothetical protein
MHSKRLEGRVARGLPFSSFQILDVEFGTADTDVYVEHSLKTDRPDEVRFEVLSIDKGGVVYRDGSASRRAWQAGYLFLRCSAADAKARIRLSTES